MAEGWQPVRGSEQEERIVAEEERICARVRRRLQGPLGGAGGPGIDFDAQLVELRDQLAETSQEDVAPLVEHMTRLAGVAALRGDDPAQFVDRSSPYFAHLELLQEERRLSLLLGRRGFVDRAAGITIIDWRNAPVSRLYYACEEGEEYEEEFGGREVEGRVLVRRGLTLEAGQLRRILAAGVNLQWDAQRGWLQRSATAEGQLAGGAGAAVRPPRVREARSAGRGRGRRAFSLGSAAGDLLYRPDRHLAEITALIDPEQFRRITLPGTGVVVIQGGAGSGKTTIALHRVAYLHYHEAARFRPASCLVVVPSEALARYVERVLPSLDVAGVPVLTVRDWARRLRQRVFPRLRLPQVELLPEPVARVKLHPAMLPLLEEYVAEQTHQLDGTLRTRLGCHTAGGEPVGATAGSTGEQDRWEAQLLLEAWEAHRDQPLVPRLQGLREWLTDAPVSGRTQLRGQVIVQELLARAEDLWADWGELFTDRPRLEAALARLAPGTFSTSVLEEVVRWCSDQQSAPTPEEEREAREARDPDEEELLGVDGGAVDELPANAGLDPADDPLLLRLHQLKHGRLVTRSGVELRYAHVAADEAQDLSAVELKVLLDATRDHSLTLAGDMAQKLVFANGLDDWATLLDRIGVPAITLEPLRISYRSTRQITLLARQVLGELADPLAPRCVREGAAVDIFSFGEEGALIALLADALRRLLAREPHCSVGVICREPLTALQVYQGLQRAQLQRLRHIAHHDFPFAPGIDVTDITQVKGLEFDYVVLPDVTAAHYPTTAASRHILHIAATRAAHQLWLLCAGEPSALLPRTADGALDGVVFFHEL